MNTNSTSDPSNNPPGTDNLDGVSTKIVYRALSILSKNKYSTDNSVESWLKLGADRLEKLEKELVEAQAEVEKLKTQLTRTGEIAEKIADEWVSADFFDEHQFIKLRSELSQITTNLAPNDKPE